MMDLYLTLPRAELQRIMPVLLGAETGPSAWGPLHRHSQAESIELLVPRLHGHTPWSTPPSGNHLSLRMHGPQQIPVATQSPPPDPGSAVLELTPDGAIYGYWRDASGRDWPFDRLSLPGAGMYHLRLTPEQPSARVRAAARWSRTAGALGQETLLRLQRLHIALIGVGRNGSLMATSLARLGVHRLTLIDPDRIEPHNLDAMDAVSAADIGRHKVDALGDLLQGHVSLQRVPLPVTRRAAVRALAEADLVISCVDHDGARLAVGMLAAAYLRPLLDVGTGVFLGEGSRRMGADVRLILPGDARCLACYGGVSQRQEVQSLLRTDPDPQPFWSALRSGSLRSLNGVAVHLGLRLLEDLVDDRISTSLWLRLDYEGAIPIIRALAPHRVHGCPVCKHAGWGDAIEQELPGLLATLLATMT